MAEEVVTTTPEPVEEKKEPAWKHLDVALDPEDWLVFKKYAISLRMPVTRVARAILYPYFNVGDK